MLALVNICETVKAKENLLYYKVDWMQPAVQV